MQFTKQEEDIYNSLVNIKDKKATQVKYELTRPRKKQNKRREDKEPSLNTVYSAVIDQQPESVYSTTAPPPPPRNDSLTKEPSCCSISAPCPVPPSHQHIKPEDKIPATKISNTYQPWAWRQQQYETWTPLFKHQQDVDALPMPTRPPPKPPILSNHPPTPKPPIHSNHPPPPQPPPCPKSIEQAPTEKASNAETLDSCSNYEPWNWRQQNYDSWTPHFNHSHPPTADLNQNISDLRQSLNKNKISPQMAQKHDMRIPTIPLSKPFISGKLKSNCEEKSLPSSPKVTLNSNTHNSSIRQGSAHLSADVNRTYEPWNWRRKMKEEGEEIYSAESDLLPPAPSPPPIEKSSPFSRGHLQKSKSILKEKKSSPEDKKKRVRMLFPEDTVTPI